VPEPAPRQQGPVHRVIDVAQIYPRLGSVVEPRSSDLPTLRRDPLLETSRLVG
jgi:hypothetical protein